MKGLWQRRELLRLVALALTLLASSFPSARAAVSAVPAERLRAEISANVSRVPELEFIREYGARHGFRAWLFGGSSVAYAHHVLWSLEDASRPETARRFRPGYLDFRLNHILRPSQDVDLVIDGTPAQAQALKREIENRFPRLLGDGNKSAWEVRLLRQEHLGKEPLQDADGRTHPEILRQNSDSMSNLLLELTDPPVDASPFIDLRNPSREPQKAGQEFIDDLRERRIRFFPSTEHSLTPRAIGGQNPEVLSVIRLFNKALQYGLDISAGDLASAREIATDFSPTRDLRTPYARARIPGEALKLIRNTLDLGRSWKLLDSAGLREKLISIESPAKIGSLGWWFSRKPLPASPIADPAERERTASELGIRTVTHRARTFEAFEALTASPTGSAEVFVSRSGADGETAHYGEGFYVSVGHEGESTQGANRITDAFDIQYALDPQARAGRDFAVVPEKSKIQAGRIADGSYVRILNAAALRLEPRAELSLISLARRLATEAQALGPGSSGRLRALLRESRQKGLPPDEHRELAELVRGELMKPLPSENLLRIWFSLPGAEDHLPSVDRAMGSESGRKALIWSLDDRRQKSEVGAEKIIRRALAYPGKETYDFRHRITAILAGSEFPGARQLIHEMIRHDDIYTRVQAVGAAVALPADDVEALGWVLNEIDEAQTRQINMREIVFTQVLSQVTKSPEGSRRVYERASPHVRAKMLALLRNAPEFHAGVLIHRGLFDEDATVRATAWASLERAQRPDLAARWAESIAADPRASEIAPRLDQARLRCIAASLRTQR